MQKVDLTYVVEVAYCVGKQVEAGLLKDLDVDIEVLARLCVSIARDFVNDEYYGYIDEFLGENLNQVYINSKLSGLTED